MIRCEKQAARLLILLAIPACLILGFNFLTRTILTPPRTRLKSPPFHRFARPKVGEMTIAEVEDIQGGAKDPLALLNVNCFVKTFYFQIHNPYIHLDSSR